MVVVARDSLAAMTSALRDIVASGEAMLFTGAGFSSEACDLDGAPLPDSRQMAAELWPVCFSGCERDDSTLADLYDVALRRAPDQLREYVCRRLRVGDAPLPTHLARWLAAPWRRIYTLNVDDLEVAAQRQFSLPHRLRSVSAIAPRGEPDPSAIASSMPSSMPSSIEAIDVIHLNGMAAQDVTRLTFSTMQYAARLCARDREYERLVEDLECSPFVFAGTTLDEVTLWQHLELRRRNNHNGTSPRRPPSFLVASSLTRARQALLECLDIHWVPASIAELAGLIFAER
jgi:hypothetical protein